jgi:GntR family transcriptional repressor for pyruvate dehydrogenase complex
VTRAKAVDSTVSAPLTTIDRTQRSAQVRIQIEQAIRRGDFAPGDRLPSERELVETFGVSRVSVREALRSLEAIGMLRVEQGRGAFVSDWRSEVGASMTHWLSIYGGELLELYRVRGALEELAATLAAELHEPEAVDKLRRANAALAEAVAERRPPSALVQLDIDFHLSLSEAGGNRLLTGLSRDLQSYLAEARRFSFNKTERPPNSVAEHAAIVEAIAAGDPHAAREATRMHLASIREVVEAVIPPLR